MSPGHSFDAKEQIRQSIDIVDLVGSYLSLRRQGRNYVGLCPFHSDSRPSLHVNAERQTWRCFVCDDGGDLFNFVMKKEGVEFRGALEILAERAGIELAPSQSKPVTPGGPDDKGTLFKALAWAEGQYHEHLLRSPDAEAARRYLQERGINHDSVARFHLGFAPDSFQWLIDRAKSTPYSVEVLAAAGLARKSEKNGRPYCFFRNRLMFPIRDTQRRPIAFGGRALPGTQEEHYGKYINTADTRLFHKSEQFYGLDLARDPARATNSFVVVEGYTDVVMAHQLGVENTIAVLGTALGLRHIKILRRFADSIVLVLDGDTAGQRRTEDILDLFVAEQADLRIMTPPDNLDPCDFLQQRGAEEFRRLVDGAVDAVEHKIRRQLQGVNPAVDTQGAWRAVEQILATLSKAPNMKQGGGAATRLRESQVLARLAREFALPEEDLRGRMGELRRRNRPRGPSQDAPADEPPRLSLTPAESEIFEILTHYPELVDDVVDTLAMSEFPSAGGRELLAVYQRRREANAPLDFSSVMTDVEDPRLKRLLVSLEEIAAAKEAAQSAESAALRLQRVMQSISAQRQQQEVRAKQAALSQKTLSDDEEIDFLRELFNPNHRTQQN